MSESLKDTITSSDFPEMPADFKGLEMEEIMSPSEEPANGKKKKKRRKKHYFLRFLCVVAVIAGLVYFLRSDYFNVTEIAVEGNQYYTAAQIQAMSGLTTGLNLFEQKTRPARLALLEDPYIKFVKISRIPPSTMKIKIEEREEYACIPYDNEYILIDNTGMVLRIAEVQPVLPILEGMTITEMNPGSPLKVEQSYLLTNTLQLLSMMSENDLYFKRINFSAVLVKAYIYDDLYCEGKPENIIANMSGIKQLMQELYSQDITRGVIKVGKDNYLTFSPKID